MAKKATNPNRKLLDEVNAVGTWFRARKTKPIRARVAKRRQTVQTLEGTETVSKGDYICRGELDEQWPQSKDNLFRTYQATGEVEVRKKLRWETFKPRSDGKGVLAAKIDHPFMVRAEWGELSGKAGDYLVKRYEDRGVDYPEDIWIVDSALFLATYERR